MSSCIEVCGHLSSDSVSAALAWVHQTTAALRLRFSISPTTGQIEWSLVSAPPDIDFHDVDAVDAPALVAAEIQRPFEADEGPLVRFVVLRTGRDRTSVLLVFHHLVTDRRGYISLLERVVASLTGDLQADDETEYRATVEHVRTGEELGRSRDRQHWVTRTAGPIGSALPPVSASTGVGGGRLLSLDTAATARLPAMHEIHGPRAPSTFLVLLAALHQCLPAAANREARRAVSAAMSLRPRARRASAPVGYFVNEMPFVASAIHADLAEIVNRECALWGQDLRHRHFPFVDLAAEVAASGTSPALLNRVSLGYLQAPPHVMRATGDLRCRAELTFHYPSTTVDISIRYFDHGEGATCAVQWGASVLAETGESFCARLAETLMAADVPLPTVGQSLFAIVDR